MHKEGEYDIDISHLSKIEGHVDLEVKIKDGKVEFAYLKISESKRFFTQGARGKHCLSVARLFSRICGTCSIVHLLCYIEAVENALQVSVSQQTKVLKTLNTGSL
jgi:coenzyme F420-reducing hydrogenase alpha subunit